MNDVVLVALFGAASAILVAVASAVANIFGPARVESRRIAAELTREREEREAQIEEKRDDLRYSAALEFTTRLGELAARTVMSTEQGVMFTRASFVATLRKGEDPVASFTQELFSFVVEAARDDPRYAQAIVEVGSDQLFAWLRGDRSMDHLNAQAARADGWALKINRPA